MIQYFVSAGARFPLLGEMESILENATKEATIQGPLRHNAVETFIENEHRHQHGLENPVAGLGNHPRCRLRHRRCGHGRWRLQPTRFGQGADAGGTCKSHEGVTEFVFDVITSRGVNACPPLLVGVGVSTSVETAARLSKKAILREVDSSHPNESAAMMERLLEDGLNEIGITAPRGSPATAA